MPIMLLHDTNLSAAKKALRALLPDVRSGHLTESLAAGLGYRTHAALIAGIAADAGRPPAIADTDDQAFAARIQTLGYAIEPSDLLARLVRSDAIPDRPYAGLCEGDRRAHDAHFALCDRTGRPMIMVKLARTYATLEWDCITTSRRSGNYPYGREGEASTSSEMVRLFDLRTAGAPGKPTYRHNVFVGWVYKLLPETAYQLAEDYFRLLYLPLREVEQVKAA